MHTNRGVQTYPLPLTLHRPRLCTQTGNTGRAQKVCPLPLALAPDDSHKAGSAGPTTLWPPLFIHKWGPLVYAPTGHSDTLSRHYTLKANKEQTGLRGS
jgi:hypothetical protein